MSDSRGGDADEEWAVTLEDLEDDEDDDESRPELEPIEPGAPTLEGAAFVVLGAALTLVVLLFGL